MATRKQMAALRKARQAFRKRHGGRNPRRNSKTGRFG